jgi:hypothetical protein
VSRAFGATRADDATRLVDPTEVALGLTSVADARLAACFGPALADAEFPECPLAELDPLSSA